MKWLEISLTLSGELAEAVSEVLNRYAPGSVAVEALGPNKKFSSVDNVHLRAYLPIDDDHPQRLRSIEKGLWHLGQINPLPDAQFRTLEEENYLEIWKVNFRPIEIGERLLVHPDWITMNDGDRIAIIISPEMAFGTGTHPSTQLCLVALEKNLSSADTVIDVGCGSGILSIAAAKLGASKVLALDIDPKAFQNSKKNILLNQLEDTIEVRLGSFPQDTLSDPEFKYDMLVANILENALVQLLAEGLSDCVRENGILIFSGLLVEQSPTFTQTCQRYGLQFIDEHRMGDWICLVFAKK